MIKKAGFFVVFLFWLISTSSFGQEENKFFRLSLNSEMEINKTVLVLSPFLAGQEQAFKEMLLGMSEEDRYLTLKVFLEKVGKSSGWGMEAERTIIRRASDAFERFGDNYDDRFVAFMINGRPDEIIGFNVRRPDIFAWRNCPEYSKIEVWHWEKLRGGLGNDIFVLFYQEGGLFKMKLWDTQDVSVLFSKTKKFNAEFGSTNSYDFSDLCADIQKYLIKSRLSYSPKVYRAMTHFPPKESPESKEWEKTVKDFLENFSQKGMRFPITLKAGQSQPIKGRYAPVQFIALVPSSLLSPIEVGSKSFFKIICNLAIYNESEEIVKEHSAIFLCPRESEICYIVMDDLLPTGYYVAYLTIRDVSSKNYGREKVSFTVLRDFLATALAGDKDVSQNQNSDSERKSFENDLVQSDNNQAKDVAIDKNRNSATKMLVSIDCPGIFVSGIRRVSVIPLEDTASIAFYLDSKLVAIKNAKPFSLDIDFGPFPRPMVLQVVALDKEGNVIVKKEIEINQYQLRPSIKIVETSLIYDQIFVRGTVFFQSFSRAVVSAYCNELLKESRLIIKKEGQSASQPLVFNVPCSISKNQITYIVLKAQFEDGSFEEDLSIIQNPGFGEKQTVIGVELPVVVLDKKKNPIVGLKQNNFAVFEEGVIQKISQIVWGDGLKTTVGLIVDCSSSMKPIFGQVIEAVEGFIKSCIRPKDEGFLVAFNQSPYLVEELTNDANRLAIAAQTIYPASTTSLYDGIIFGLSHFVSIGGSQKVAVLITDGASGHSESALTSVSTFDQVVASIRQSGVVLYIIALNVSQSDKKAYQMLKTFADVSGGEVFYPKDVDQLRKALEEINKQIHSGYLLFYTSSSSKTAASSFRRVVVKVNPDKKYAAIVRHPEGYYLQNQ